MNSSKKWKLGAVSYLILYLVAMVLPRTIPLDQVTFAQTNRLSEIFNHVLYYNGPFEPVANFLILVPVFFIVHKFLGRSNSFKAMFLCLLLAASVEIGQRFNPGRISSFQDFALNASGVYTAYLLNQYLMFKRKVIRHAQIDGYTL